MDSASNVNNDDYISYIDQMKKIGSNQKIQQVAEQKPGTGEASPLQWTSVSDNSMNASQAPAAGLEAPLGQRFSASAHETNAADPSVSKDVKDIAARMLESDDVEHPHKELNIRFGVFAMGPEAIIVLAASEKDDDIHISQGENEGIVVSVNGEEYKYTKDEARMLIIDAGSGNDIITVDENVKNPLYMTGGKGDDRIQGGSGDDIIVDNYGANYIDGGAGDDEIIAHGYANSGEGYADNIIKGGAGNDYIEGGFGNDFIDGGEGDDIIYGLDGNDTIYGGPGNDFIDGGAGDDIIYGGEGDDKLFGGEGDDTIYGGEGNNLIVGGKGNDRIDGGGGSDRIVVYDMGGGDENNDIISYDEDDNIITVPYKEGIPGNISVKGDAAFQARVKSDLVSMASIPPGQAVLDAIGGDGHTLTIRETHGVSHVNPASDEAFISYDDNNVASRGKGANSELAFNPASHNLYGGENSWSETIPLIGLTHAMGHAYDNAKGQADSAYYDPVTHEHLMEPDGKFTQNAFSYSNFEHMGEPGYEYQTIGGMGYSQLPNDGVEREEHPKDFYENAMRQFLGYELRDSCWSAPDVDHEIDKDKL